jgi:hypothetical protein
LESVLKAAALGGDPHYFYLFYDRLQRKRFPINNAILKSLTDKWKTGSLNRDPRMSGVKLSANDFSNTMAIVLRVHNYRLAIELIRECRDTHNIQPDAYMYETFLEACIRAGHLREKARFVARRFLLIFGFAWALDWSLMYRPSGLLLQHLEEEVPSVS